MCLDHVVHYVPSSLGSLFALSPLCLSLLSLTCCTRADGARYTTRAHFRPPLLLPPLPSPRTTTCLCALHTLTCLPAALPRSPLPFHSLLPGTPTVFSPVSSTTGGQIVNRPARRGSEHLGTTGCTGGNIDIGLARNLIRPTGACVKHLATALQHRWNTTRRTYGSDKAHSVSSLPYRRRRSSHYALRRHHLFLAHDTST